MAYTKTVWVSGVAPPMSAANMNNLETQYESIVADFKLGGLVVKLAEESIDTSEVMQNDDELVVPVAANTDYAFVAMIVVQSASATPDIDYTFTVPAAITEGGWEHSPPTAGITVIAFATEDGIQIGAGQTRLIVLRGYLQNGVNADNLQFQWAQGTSNGTATTVKAGSYLALYG